MFFREEVSKTGRDMVRRIIKGSISGLHLMRDHYVEDDTVKRDLGMMISQMKKLERYAQEEN